MKPTADDPNPYGKCGTCRHWTEFIGREGHYCELSEEPAAIDDTCPDYARREEP